MCRRPHTLTQPIWKMLSQQVVMISVAGTLGWIWCLLEGNTGWSQLDVCVCVGSFRIFALSLLPSPLFIFWSVLLRPHCPPSPLSFLAPLRPLFSLFCCLSAVVSISSSTLHPTVEAEKGKLSHSSLYVSPPSTHLCRPQVKRGSVWVKLSGQSDTRTVTLEYCDCSQSLTLSAVWFWYSAIAT